MLAADDKQAMAAALRRVADRGTCCYDIFSPNVKEEEPLEEPVEAMASIEELCVIPVIVYSAVLCLQHTHTTSTYA